MKYHQHEAYCSHKALACVWGETIDVAYLPPQVIDFMVCSEI